MKEEKLNISVGQLLSSLSLSLDIAENRYYEHSRRVAYIAYNISKSMGLDDKIVMHTYYSALLHDIGMSGSMSSHNISRIDSEPSLKKKHCALGAKIVKGLPFDEDVSQAILYHHEDWDGGGSFGLEKEEIPIISQIIHVADRFDVNYGINIKNIENTDNIKRQMERTKGKEFNPIVIDSLLNLMNRDKLWLDLRFPNLQQVIDANVPDMYKSIDILGLKSIAHSFSVLIDSKSKFTHNHSKGIAEITRKLARYIGYENIMVDKLEIAAYLHDIGKMIVPNGILEKPSKLSNDEFNIIKSHAYYTKLILKQVKGLKQISEWAGNHHEKLNGKGYPEGIDYRTITREDQIIAVADIYQAITEDRPYRQGLSHKEAIEVLSQMVKGGFISGEIVRYIDKAI